MATLSSYANAQALTRLCFQTGTSVQSCQTVTAANPLPTTATLSGTNNISQLGVTTITQSNITITPTNTFLQILASNISRKGCTIQYRAISGTNGYVSFVTPGNTATSWKLTDGQTVNCSIGGDSVATDAIYGTGTNNDIFVFSQQ